MLIENAILLAKHHHITLDQLSVLWCIANKKDIRDIVSAKASLIQLEKDLYIKLTENKIILRKKALGMNLSVAQSTEQFIAKYRKLFAGRKIKAMGDKIACEKKMEWFFKTYPSYTQEQILKATAKYIQEQSLSNYMYLQQADYFIRKQDNDRIGRSNLAIYCEGMNSPDAIEGNVDKFKTVL